MFASRGGVFDVVFLLGVNLDRKLTPLVESERNEVAKRTNRRSAFGPQAETQAALV